MKQCFSLLFVLFVFRTENAVASIMTNGTPTFNENNDIFSSLLKNEANEIECQTKEDCDLYFDNLECKDNVCKCSDPLTLSSDGTQCLEPQHFYGSACYDSTQCYKALSAGGSCINNKCGCKEGYHYLKGSCHKNRGLRQTCASSEQCIASYEYRGLECKEKKCICRSEYYERFESGCRRKRNLMESCNIDSDCSAGTMCEKMKCVSYLSPQNMTTPKKYFSAPKTAYDAPIQLECALGYFEENGACYLELGMPCATNEECNHISHASCIDEICTCELVTYVPRENNRECLKVARAKIPDITKVSCKENAQCGVFGPQSFCNGKHCDCQGNTYFNEFDQYCWPTKELGENCNADKDCGKEKHAECKLVDNQNVCACKDGFHEENKICLVDAYLGDNCETDASCISPHTYCNETTKTCVCQEYYFEVESTKECVGGLGSPCEDQNNCSHIENAICSSSVCQCNTNYASNHENKVCLQGSHYKESCIESAQCQLFLGENADCILYSCECKAKSVYSEFSGKCNEIKYIGEKCVKQLDCIPGKGDNSVLCFKGVCTCNFDYTLSDSKICVPSKSVAVPTVHYPLILLVFFYCFLQILLEKIKSH